jgi:hypothetical protein
VDAASPRIVVYTTVFGYTDPLHEPAVRGDARFVCFTDQPLQSKNWEIVRVDPAKKPTRLARAYKAEPKKLFPDADWWLWMDANFTLQVPPEVLLHHGEWVTFRHADRKRITDEAAEIVRLHKAKREAISAQLKAYHKAGFDTDANPMTELSCNGVMLRRNTEQNEKLCRAWAEELSVFSLRDQMSLDYCAWRLGVTLQRWPGTHRNNPYFKFTHYKRSTNDF